MNIKKYITTVIKYGFSVLLMIRLFISFPSKKILLMSLVELGIIALTTNVIMKPKPAKGRRICGRIFNTVAFLLLNAQLLIMFFSRTFLMMVMLTNTDSMASISGQAVRYAIGVILVVAASILPVEYISLKKEKGISGEEAESEAESDKNLDDTVDDIEGRTKVWSYRFLTILLAFELLLVFVFGFGESPIFAYGLLAKEKMDIVKRQNAAKQSENTNVTTEFYKDCVYDGIERPEELGENPNIVYIMTEGFSKNIIDDSRDVMPNMRKLSENGISFEKYYNHTFATYRGIIGQLYSGYQEGNDDENTLVSIMDVLEKRGYHTICINVEPENEIFSDYLGRLGFDEVRTGKPDKSGNARSLSDGKAYKLLHEVIKEESEKDAPYFIVMYTFGTHVSFNSKEEKYGDGSVAFYNKFYNADYQFGTFFDEWSESKYADNTLLVMTGDHGTYGDEGYAEAFPEYNATRYTAVMDEMPFILWHKGIKPQVIDARGRNSLSAIPTVLDYVDISEPNYFLGETLFYNYGSYYDTIFQEEGFLYSSTNGRLTSLVDSEADEAWNYIYMYYNAKKQTPQVPEE